MVQGGRSLAGWGDAGVIKLACVGLPELAVQQSPHCGRLWVRAGDKQWSHGRQGGCWDWQLGSKRSRGFLRTLHTTHKVHCGPFMHGWWHPAGRPRNADQIGPCLPGTKVSFKPDGTYETARGGRPAKSVS